MLQQMCKTKSTGGSFGYKLEKYEAIVLFRFLKVILVYEELFLMVIMCSILNIMFFYYQFVFNAAIWA